MSILKNSNSDILLNSDISIDGYLHNPLSKDVSINKNLPNWYPSDTPHLFNSNFKKYPNNPSLIEYNSNPIKYELNQYGFRTDSSFNSNTPGNVFLGCSHTFGIGHHLENTWSYNLNKKIGGEFYNLSVPGHGVNTSFRLLLNWYDKLNINNVFHYLPFYARYEYYMDDRFETLMLSNLNHKQETYLGRMKYPLVSKQQIAMNTVAYSMAIESICKSINVNYYVLSENDLNNEILKDVNHSVKNNISLKSRDLIHYSVYRMEKLENLFLTKL